MENEKQSSRWVVVVVCGALTLLLVIGTVLTLRDQMVASARAEAKEQAKEREKLAGRIDMIQSALDNLDTAPKTDSSALNGLAGKLTDAEAKIETLTSRIEALEKQVEGLKSAPVPVQAPVAVAPVSTPAPAPVEQTHLTELTLAVRSGQPFAKELSAWVKRHPESENDIVALREIATSGLISEAELSRSLLAALDTRQTAPVLIDDTSMVGKINAHLKGLVSIRKSVADPYTTLRNDALHEDAETLERDVERLSDADREVLANWLKQARQRRAALDALAKLSNGASE